MSKNSNAIGFLAVAAAFIVMLLVMLWNPFNLSELGISWYFVPVFGYGVYRIIKSKKE